MKKDGLHSVMYLSFCTSDHIFRCLFLYAFSVNVSTIILVLLTEREFDTLMYWCTYTVKLCNKLLDGKHALRYCNLVASSHSSMLLLTLLTLLLLTPHTPPCSSSFSSPSSSWSLLTLLHGPHSSHSALLLTSRLHVLFLMLSSPSSSLLTLLTLLLLTPHTPPHLTPHPPPHSSHSTLLPPHPPPPHSSHSSTLLLTPHSSHSSSLLTLLLTAIAPCPVFSCKVAKSRSWGGAHHKRSCMVKPDMGLPWQCPSALLQSTISYHMVMINTDFI